MQTEKNPEGQGTNEVELSRANIQNFLNNSPVANRVYSALLSGPCSVIDLMLKCRVSDPRGHIRTLRNHGITIYDTWKTSENGRFKIYFIKKSNK